MARKGREIHPFTPFARTSLRGRDCLRPNVFPTQGEKNSLVNFDEALPLKTSPPHMWDMCLGRKRRRRNPSPDQVSECRRKFPLSKTWKGKKCSSLSSENAIFIAVAAPTEKGSLSSSDGKTSRRRVKSLSCPMAVKIALPVEEREGARDERRASERAIYPAAPVKRRVFSADNECFASLPFVDFPRHAKENRRIIGEAFEEEDVLSHGRNCEMAGFN